MSDVSGQPEGAATPAKVVRQKSRGSARVTNGTDLLPSVDGRSVWARLLRDTIAAMVRHLGGDDQVSEVQRLSIRRVAALEAELIYIEDSIAKTRHEGNTPEAALLDLYARLGNAQRRHLEPLGWQSVPRDVTSLEDIITQDRPRIESGSPPMSQNHGAATPVAAEGK